MKFLLLVKRTLAPFGPACGWEWETRGTFLESKFNAGAKLLLKSASLCEAVTVDHAD